MTLAPLASPLEALLPPPRSRAMTATSPASAAFNGWEMRGGWNLVGNQRMTHLTYVVRNAGRKQICFGMRNRCPDQIKVAAVIGQLIAPFVFRLCTSKCLTRDSRARSSPRMLPSSKLRRRVSAVLPPGSKKARPRPPRACSAAMTFLAALRPRHPSAFIAWLRIELGIVSAARASRV